MKSRKSKGISTLKSGIHAAIPSYSYSYSYSAERYSYSYSNGGSMTEPIFDHEKLDVYRLSIDDVAASYL